MNESDNKPKPVSIRSFLLAMVIVGICMARIRIVHIWSLGPEESRMESAVRHALAEFEIGVFAGIAIACAMALVSRLLLISASPGWQMYYWALGVGVISFFLITLSPSMRAVLTSVRFWSPDRVFGLFASMLVTPLFWWLFGWVEGTKPSSSSRPTNPNRSNR